MNKNVVPLRHPRGLRRERYRQATRWLLRLQAEGSERVRADLDAWLCEDPENARALVEVADLWDRMGSLSGLAELFPLEGFAGKAGLGSRGVRVRAWFSGAAALVLAALILGGIGVGYQGWMQVMDPAAAHGETTYATAVGRQLAVSLADGSEVVLNTDTRLHVHFSATQRRIVLEQGEAYFSVAPDSQRPFRVYAGSRYVEAVGTAFSVQRTEPGGIEITVSEGRVNLLEPVSGRRSAARGARPSDGAGAQIAAGGGDDGVVLVPGDHVRVHEQSGSIEKQSLQPGTVDARLAWRHGMLFFQGEPLEVVLREVNRYTTTPIQAEVDILQVPVIGVFRVDNMERLLAAMQENFRFDVDRVGDERIVLRRR